MRTRVGVGSLFGFRECHPFPDPGRQLVALMITKQISWIDAGSALPAAGKQLEQL